MAYWLQFAAYTVFWVGLTLLVWEGCGRAHKALGQPYWAPPLLLAMLALVALLGITRFPYTSYARYTQPLSFLLGPATVALAVPLYKALPRLMAAVRPILLTVLLGSFFTSGLAVALAWGCGLSHSSVLAFTTRAVTTPIAIGIAAKTGAPVVLVAAIVIVSGLLGAMLAEPLLGRLRSDAARGLALGLAAHGVGTARAFQLHPTAGAFAALGMGLNGLLTAFWLPPLVHWLAHAG
jgi:putative effector of murein hydrolase